MKTYQIKITHAQINHLFVSLNWMLTQLNTIEQLNHIDYYNVRTLLKRLADKMYRLEHILLIPNRKKNINISLNEHQSILNLYNANKEEIEEHSYYLTLYLDVFAQCNKQEVEIKDLHKYPKNVIHNHINELEQLDMISFKRTLAIK